jgi:hypothetical protein
MPVPTATVAPQACPQVTANTTNITFYLNTSTANWTQAEDACKRNGGHLAAFQSMEEQREVEQYYIVNGYLLPKFHKFYWSGLYAPKAWPYFKWIEPTFPAPATSNYAYWGSNDNTTEPNQKTELCGGSHVTYVDATDNTWGWADNNCSNKEVYMCRVMREQPAQLRCGCLAQAHSVPAALYCMPVRGTASCQRWVTYDWL